MFIKNHYNCSFFIRDYLGNCFVSNFFSYDILLLRVSSELSDVDVFLFLAKYVLLVSLSCTLSKLSASSFVEDEEENEESFVFLIFLYNCADLDCFPRSMPTIVSIRDGRFFCNPLHLFLSSCRNNKFVSLTTFFLPFSYHSFSFLLNVRSLISFNILASILFKNKFFFKNQAKNCKYFETFLAKISVPSIRR